MNDIFVNEQSCHPERRSSEALAKLDRTPNYTNEFGGSGGIWDEADLSAPAGRDSGQLTIINRLEHQRHAITAISIAIITVLSVAVSFPQQSVKASAPQVPAVKLKNMPNSPLKIPIIGPSSKTDPSAYIYPASLNNTPVEPISLSQNTILGGWLMSGAEDDFAYLGNIFSFNQLSPFWWELGSDGATVNDKLSFIPVKQFMAKAKARNIKVFPSITADPNIATITLSAPERRTQLVTNILDRVTEAGVTGIDIDFELLAADDASNFVAFLQELSKALHSRNKLLTVDLEARINNQVTMDWKAIGASADYVHIMGYDYHSRGSSAPGPIGPIGWLKEVMNYAKGMIPPEKIILGLGTYGYDWYPASDGTLKADGLTFADVQALVTQYHPAVARSSGTDELDYEVGNVPNFSYTDEKGLVHFVWYEDKDSILEKMSLARGIGGIYFWRLNAEDNTVWQNIAKSLPK